MFFDIVDIHVKKVVVFVSTKIGIKSKCKFIKVDLSQMSSDRLFPNLRHPRGKVFPFSIKRSRETKMNLSRYLRSLSDYKPLKMINIPSRDIFQIQCLKTKTEMGNDLILMVDRLSDRVKDLTVKVELSHFISEILLTVMEMELLNLLNE